MSEGVSGINPLVLKWARLRAGLTVAEVARTTKKSAEVISGWESGAASPTYLQLETLAYRLYKRPIALFFFPEPPVESDPKQSFRTLPAFEIDALSSDTRYAIRLGEAMQLSLRELGEGKNTSERKIFVDIEALVDTDFADLATRVREYLGVHLSEQTSWRNKDEALKNWRDAVQEAGVFVFKRSFKQRDVHGFCLFDEEFPVIYLNNSTAVARQIFTLFHELSHILLHTNGVTKQNDQYIDSLRGEPKRIEVLCNRFAAEFLVPSDDFDKMPNLRRIDDRFVNELAEKYSVSREVILRKLLDRGFVDQAHYNNKALEWAREFEKSRQRRKGGNFYATTATYLGTKFLNMAFERYYQGRCTIEQLAEYLNVKVQSVPGLEQYALKTSSR